MHILYSFTFPQAIAILNKQQILQTANYFVLFRSVNSSQQLSTKTNNSNISIFPPETVMKDIEWTDTASFSIYYNA